eukprot:2516060-Pyramimonas_sp.AAC.1
MSRALIDADPASLAEYVFEQNARVFSADRRPSNQGSHNRLMMQRDSSWTSLGFDCEAHVNFKAHNEAGGHVKWALRGMCDVALALETAGDANCTQEVIKSKIRFCRGKAPNATIVYKRCAIRTFLAGHSQGLQRRILFSVLPDGDWTDQQWIDMWVRTDEEFNEPLRA